MRAHAHVCNGARAYPKAEQDLEQDIEMTQDHPGSGVSCRQVGTHTVELGHDERDQGQRDQGVIQDNVESVTCVRVCVRACVRVWMPFPNMVRVLAPTLQLSSSLSCELLHTSHKAHPHTPTP